MQRFGKVPFFMIGVSLDLGNNDMVLQWSSLYFGFKTNKHYWHLINFDGPCE